MTLPTAYNLDRQAILDRVHAHFIVNREPAGRIDGSAQCVFHGDQGEACAIGIFDDEGYLDDSVNEHGVSDLSADRLEAVFGQELTLADIDYLSGVQCAHDMAVFGAATLSDGNFDESFVEELTHQLDCLARAQDLCLPCSAAELAYEAQCPA